MNVLISACLLGQACRYDGKTKEYAAIHELQEKQHICWIPICPEQAGGLPTPRDPAERRRGDVITSKGADVTAQYQQGACQTLRLAQMFQCAYAVLKEKSPSCGCGKIYDGTFTRTLTDGDGVTAEVLKKNGIVVLGESGPFDVLRKDG